MQIVIEDRQIGPIPVLNVYDTNFKKVLPVLIMLHGFTSCKENNLKDAYKLARKGFYLILFDAVRHGEREDPEFKKLNYYEKAPFLADIEIQSSREINRILHGHQDIVQADCSRVGLIGFSMGGNTIYKYLSGTIPGNIKAAVPLIATACWAHSIQQYLEANPNLQNLMTPADFELLHDAEPKDQMDNLRDFPLLMLNGVRDEKVPIEDVRYMYGKLVSQYTNQSKIQQIEYPDFGHQVSNGMIERAGEWFRKYL